MISFMTLFLYFIAYIFVLMPRHVYYLTQLPQHSISLQSSPPWTALCSVYALLYIKQQEAPSSLSDTTSRFVNTVVSDPYAIT